MFLEGIHAKDYTKAVQSLNWDHLLEVFTKVGIAPNVTEGECSSWITTLLTEVLVDPLRSEGSAAMVSECSAMLGGISTAAKMPRWRQCGSRKDIGLV